ncbi:hypothetical protein N3K66_002662 [Trichothecium roseum]|uniref:Uncharacterized protein n=1 Tax=Trichothecium roseum TaxID=47278 RepID=A0ACC0VA65_9HYPO|nr:hypothetical protein N3K66_002662 [Trichothecium roseum]
MTDSARWKATVHVGGLSPLANEANIFDAFLPFGDIVEVQVPKPDGAKSSEPHKGFAYVEFEDIADAKEAIDNMDQSEFFGRVIKVSQAKIPKSADEGLGSKKAVWEQEDWISKHATDEPHDMATADQGPDPMQGLEGLDVAGPKLA